MDAEEGEALEGGDSHQGEDTEEAIVEARADVDSPLIRWWWRTGWWPGPIGNSTVR